VGHPYCAKDEIFQKIEDFLGEKSETRIVGKWLLRRLAKKKETPDLRGGETGHSGGKTVKLPFGEKHLEKDSSNNRIMIKRDGTRENDRDAWGNSLSTVERQRRETRRARGTNFGKGGKVWKSKKETFFAEEARKNFCQPKKSYLQRRKDEAETKRESGSK